ncbi:MAG: DUF3179 domain-containing protein [Saprospiraceae bacterium]|nr:DUF3179 domain-containing protein [Saprospiraceae bacterium]
MANHSSSKYLFHAVALCWILFEILHVYFIMPMPGSQEINSLDVAYFLHYFRWSFRFILGVLLLLNFKIAFATSKWLTLINLFALIYTIYLFNLKMSADVLFQQPQSLEFQYAAKSKVDLQRLILGINFQNESKAYTIQYLGYHHQVRDTIGGKPVMVTYCTVCRTGRVFEPVVNGREDQFRLVGMDHFNAMFEDQTSKSWWRQVNGEAVAGKMKGQFLPEFPSAQMTLQKWLEIYPNSLIMQPDTFFQIKYDSMSTYEFGKYYGKLTKRDRLSWKEKSWILGIKLGKLKKAYDWNYLAKHGMIYDSTGKIKLVVLLASDKKSFSALQIENGEPLPVWKNDTLYCQNQTYNLLGQSHLPGKSNLNRIPCYQEYWHSWRFFNPETLVDLK